MNLKHLIPLGLLILTTPAAASTRETLDGFLREGRIKEGLAAYATPAGNAERFSLAVLQTLDGLQRFSADMVKLGIKADAAGQWLPFFRVVLPGRPPAVVERATPAEVARVFREFRASLRRANGTLAGIGQEEFGVEVNLSQTRLDFDGDGICATNETLVASLRQIFSFQARGPASQDVIVRFDRADAIWLRGYTHFLSGVLDLLLAYDWQPVWNQCAHLIFLQPDPLPPIARVTQADGSFAELADVIAAVHDMRLQQIEKNGPRQALDEFRAMISCSRDCWRQVLAETDNDKEWLPSPRQTGPGGAKVSQEQIDGWLRVLDELDAVASGKKLLPHWRIKPGLGINVQKLVASPPPFDLVLLIQGSALVPYVEEGPVSDRATWRQLMQPFGPGFAQFAIWSN